ncbi:MAG: DNA repair protein RecN [Bacteroidota bacterium]|nr:DNA repair protein RecN [Bacteroidota bacterium]
MLKHLHIQNYALIEKLEIDFDQGMNIITGETGAGKSIIIDALSLILGERADTDAIRKDADKAIVEGTFDVSQNKNIKPILKENEIDFSDEVILRREVSIKGTSRCFVNDTPVSLGMMKNIGDLLVDLHGQHEHQSLLRTETHNDLLDDFAALSSLVEEFKAAYNQLTNEVSKLTELQNREKLINEKKDLYEFQLKEIDAVNPTPDEEAHLESELKILENSEKLNEETNQLYNILYDGENSIIVKLSQSLKHIEQLLLIDETFGVLKKEAESADAIVKELTASVRDYISKIEFSPEKLEHHRNRLGQISLLKKKYGGSIETIIEFKQKLEAELQLVENFDAEINRVKETIENNRKIASELAKILSVKRNEAAKKVNSEIVKVLAELGINNSKFETRVDNRIIKSGNSENAFIKIGKDFYETTPKGIDFVEFFISTNIGEDVKPLAKVASGGEISRIMLSLKTILAKSEKLPLLIFDEIDIGISGRIAQVVGLSLKNLSRLHQIIAITHLPQIAGLADTHYVVEKVEDGKRSATKLRKLTLEERIYQVAKLMSGTVVTESTLKSAKELLNIK